MDMHEATNSLLNRLCCNCGPLDLSCLGEKNALDSQIFLSHFAPRPQKQFAEAEETQRGLQAKAALLRHPTGLCGGGLILSLEVVKVQYVRVRLLDSAV